MAAVAIAAEPSRRMRSFVRQAHRSIIFVVDDGTCVARLMTTSCPAIARRRLSTSKSLRRPVSLPLCRNASRLCGDRDDSRDLVSRCKSNGTSARADDARSSRHEYSHVIRP